MPYQYACRYLRTIRSPNDAGKQRMADAIRRVVVDGFVHAPAH